MGTGSEAPSSEEDPEYIADITRSRGQVRVQQTAVYPYREELLVELTLTDETDTLVVETVAFERVDDTTVSPKGDLPVAYAKLVLETVHDEGYNVVDYP